MASKLTRGTICTPVLQGYQELLCCVHFLGPFHRVNFAKQAFCHGYLKSMKHDLSLQRSLILIKRMAEFMRYRCLFGVSVQSKVALGCEFCVQGPVVKVR